MKCTKEDLGKLTGSGSIEKELGNGEFGEVILEKYGTIFTAKKTRKEGAGLQEFKSEIRLMCELKDSENEFKKLNKNFIVEFFGCDNMDNPQEIFMEYCPALSLHNNLVNKSFVGDYEFKKIIIHLARGMQYVHSFNIVHRDLAARNILVYDLNLKFNLLTIYQITIIKLLILV